MTDLTSSVEIEGSSIGSNLSIDYRSIDTHRGSTADSSHHVSFSVPSNSRPGQ